MLLIICKEKPMNVYEERLKTLESEIANLRVNLEKFIASKAPGRSMKKQNREKIIKLFGQWDGEVDGFLSDFYERRQRRGRFE
jgi:hypothetical protein